MKNANKRDLPSTEAIIFSIMKDKCFKLPYLKTFTGFPLAFQIKSKLLNMAYRSFRTWPLLTSLPHLLINDSHILFIQTGRALEIWNAYVSGVLVQIKVYQRQHFVTIISHVL